MRANPEPRGTALGVALLAGLMLLPAQPAASADEDRVRLPARREAMAEARVNAGGIELAPRVGYRKAILTVSGPAGVFRRDIGAEEALQIGLFDPRGDVLADGAYRWELRLVPDAAMAEKLRAMARAGLPTHEVWPAESGTFYVAGGAIISDTGMSEPAPARRVDPDAAAGLNKVVGFASAQDRAAAASRDGDEGVAAGRVEPTGAEARTLAAGDAKAAPPATESAAARAAAGDDDGKVEAGQALELKAAEAAERRPGKYPTPDNQGRPKGAKPDGR